MFSLFYDLCLLIIALVALPKLIWLRLVKGKYKNSLRARLGLSLPALRTKPGQQVIWIHAVSMGETRAIIPLFQKLRTEHPGASIVISTTTETGQAEAQRSMPDADAHFYLPFDFSWIMRRFLNKLRPSLLILCESDFWYHLLKIAKGQNTTVVLVNGKVSERSYRRFLKAPFFTNRLFENFDAFCLQSERYAERFLAMGIPKEKISITGNIKLDAPSKKMSTAERHAFKESLGIHDGEQVLVIGSTHDPEEELLLAALDAVWKRLPRLKVLLVPRHPERFEEVARLIEQRAVPYSRLADKHHPHRIILIDAMGMLNQCYQIADAALVGGSYTSQIGGHNVFEPVVFGVPVFFGPYMHNQADLKDLVLNAKAGSQVNIDALPDALIEFLEIPQLRNEKRKNCENLSHTVQGATGRTLAIIQESMKNSLSINPVVS